MPTTATFGWTTPADSAANDVPADLAALAAQIEATVANITADKVWIGSTWYQRSGAWPQQDLSSPTGTYGSVYTWTILKPLPFTPPAGWTFQTFQVFQSGFGAAGTGNIVGGNIETRIINVGSSVPTIRLGWQLVKL